MFTWCSDPIDIYKQTETRKPTSTKCTKERQLHLFFCVVNTFFFLLLLVYLLQFLSIWFHSSLIEMRLGDTNTIMGMIMWDHFGLRLQKQNDQQYIGLSLRILNIYHTLFSIPGWLLWNILHCKLISFLLFSRNFFTLWFYAKNTSLVITS